MADPFLTPAPEFLLPQQRPLPTPDDVDTLGAAFRLENDMVNLWEYSQGRVAPSDPNFDVTEYGKQSDLWMPFYPQLAKAQSAAEFDTISARIRREQADRQALASQGLSGFAAGMLAGVFSPTMLLPLVGPARGAKGIAQAFGLAGVAAVGAEAPLMANQYTRTSAESFTGIAAGTVLGGLLGSASVMLRKPDFDRMAGDLMPDAPTSGRSAVLRQGDGAIVRVGEDVPLRARVGTAVNPRAATRITRLEGQADVVRQALARGGVEEVEALAKAPDASLELKELAAGVRKMTAASSSVVRAAQAEGASPQVSQALKAISEAGPLSAEATPAQRAAATRRENKLRTELEKSGLTDRVAQDEFIARVAEAEAQLVAPTPEAALLQTLQEKTDGLLVKEADDAATGASTTGAKAKGDQFVLTVEEIAEDGSVTQVPLTKMTDAGDIAPATMLGRFAAHTSPVLRSIMQTDTPVISRAARRIMSLLSDSGVELEGNRFGLLANPEGTVEARMNYYQALLARSYEAQIKAYNKYITGTERPTGTARISQLVRMETNKAPQGKLGFVDFKKQVAHALNSADTSDIPEVAALAKTMRTEFFEKINEAMNEAADVWGGKPLYTIKDLGEDMSYFPHQFSPGAVAQKRVQFIEDVATQYRDAMTASFTRRIQKELQGLEADNAYEAALRLEGEEAAALYEETTESIKALQNSLKDSPELDRARALRDTAADLLDDAYERELNGIAEPLREDALMIAASRKRAKESVKEEVDALKAEAALLEADYLKKNPVDAETKGKLKVLRAQQRAVNRSYGRLEAKQQRVYDRIAQNEERNLNALSRIQNGTKRLIAGMSRLDDKKLDAEFNKLMTAIDRDMKLIERGEARITKLQAGNNIEPNEKLALEQARQLMREAKAKKKAQRAGEALFFDRQAARDALQANLDEVMQTVNKLNNKRAERNALLRQQAKELDPARVDAEISAMRTRRTGRLEQLDTDLQQAGATDINVEAAQFDFTDIAEEMATDLANKIIGNYTRIAQLDVMPELRGPLKHRVLDIPYERKQQYLELDTEQVLARYARTIGSDIELYRATGSIDGRKAVDSVMEDLDNIDKYLATREVDKKGVAITATRRDKEMKQHLKARQRRQKEITAVIERVRGLRGLPSDPTGIPYRLGRLFMNMNVTTMMGSVAVTSIPDAGRAVMTMGLTRTFEDSWKPLIQGLVDDAQKGANASVMRELRLAGVGIDVFTGSRAMGSWDIEEFRVGQTQFERGFEYLAQKMPQAALFGQWTDGMKMIAGLASMSRILETTSAVAKGSTKQEDLLALSRAGISPQYAKRIQAEMERTATRYKDVLIPNTEAWTDYQALRVFQAALSHEDARMVITPGLEKPLWMDASILGRIVGQFRSFTMASNTKMLVAGLQSRNMAGLHTLQGMMFSLALGTVSYYIWAMTTSERARQEMMNADWQVWADQAIYRSGMLGVFSEAQSIGSAIPATADFTTFAGGELAGRRAGNLMGKVLGPSFGKAREIEQFLLGIDDPTASTVAQARKLIPMQNVFYLRELLNQVEGGVSDVFNLPERRQ